MGGSTCRDTYGSGTSKDAEERLDNGVPERSGGAVLIFNEFNLFLSSLAVQMSGGADEL
jgi:hypothetical protein